MSLTVSASRFNYREGQAIFLEHIWDNDKLTDEKIGLGTILKYEQLGKEYLYTKNTESRPQVSTGIQWQHVSLYSNSVE